MIVAERTRRQTLCLTAHLLLSRPLIFNVTPLPVLFTRSFSLPLAVDLARRLACCFLSEGPINYVAATGSTTKLNKPQWATMWT